MTEHPSKLWNSMEHEIMGMVMVCGLILWHQSLRNRTYLTISALSSPEQSPWNHLWRNGDDNSFVNLTGFSRDAFHELHCVVFGRLVDEQEPRKRGRPQKLNSVAKLGLILHFLNSTSSSKTPWSSCNLAVNIHRWSACIRRWSACIHSQHLASLYDPDLASLYYVRHHFFSLLDWASSGLLALFRGACRIGRLSVSEVLPGDSPM